MSGQSGVNAIKNKQGVVGGIDPNFHAAQLQEVLNNAWQFVEESTVIGEDSKRVVCGHVAGEIVIGIASIGVITADWSCEIHNKSPDDSSVRIINSSGADIGLVNPSEGVTIIKNATGTDFEFVTTNNRFPTIERNFVNRYTGSNPPDNVEVNTGYDAASLGTTADLFFSLIVTVNTTGNNYVLFQQTGADAIVQAPDVRFTIASEFENVQGDVDTSYWYSSATNTIHYTYDVDGGNKSVISAAITTTEMFLL